MTNEQILQNAKEYADVFGRHMVDYYGVKDAFIAGAHSRDEEIEELQNELESLRKGFYERGDKLKELMLKNNELRNPWISVDDRLPEKSIGLYELEKDEQHKKVLFKTATGNLFIGYLDAEEIWRAFTVQYKGACIIDSFTWSKVTHWMSIPQIEKGE